MRHAALSTVLTATLLLCPGCGDEIEFEGEAGQPTPMKLRAWVPVLDMQVGDDQTPRPMLVDTGSPIMTFSTRAFPALAKGAHQLDFTVFGLKFLGFTGYALDLFGGKAICGGTPAGLIGGDLMRHFRLGLDYRGKRAFLFYGDDDDPPVASGTAGSEAVAVQVLGGGLGELVERGSGIFIEVGATRVVVAQALVEGKTVNVMVDTGASLTVVEASLLKSLGGKDRPSLCCETVAVVDGLVKLPKSRLRSLRLGSVTVSSLPVLVVDPAATGNALFANISAETGVQIQMLVGGSFLRHFAVNLDYQEGRMSLARYQNQDHVSANEYVGPGFSFCASASSGDHVVVDVYQGTDAQTVGILPGSVLQAVEGTKIKGMTQDQVLQLMRKTPVGSKVKLDFGAAQPIEVKVERLLGDYK